MGIGIAIAAFTSSFSGPLEFFVERNIVSRELDTGRLATEHFFFLALFKLLSQVILVWCMFGGGVGVCIFLNELLRNVKRRPKAQNKVNTTTYRSGKLS